MVKYSDEFDRLSNGECYELEKAVQSVRKFIENSSAISDVRYATRDAHAKTYATAYGKFTVSENLPEFLSSIFSKKEYAVTARISNGNLVINKNGRDAPLYGFSLKIKDVEGKDINYPLVNFPLFPTNSPTCFLKMFTSVNTFLVTKEDNFVVSALDLPHLMRNGLSVAGSMFSMDLIKKLVKFLKHRNDFLLSFTYSGIGCFRMGDAVIKLSLTPINIRPEIGKGEPQNDSVKWYLSKFDTAYELRAQVCEDLKSQPVNDLMTDWKNAPEYILGTVNIPKAALLNSDDPAIENLNFNPFENPEELQPVGKIQQIRKRIYEVSAATRNRLNGIHPEI